MDRETGAWFDRELAGCSLADERLKQSALIDQLHQLV
jgi:hypothetical protein